jgi:hypothetical protein
MMLNMAQQAKRTSGTGVWWPTSQIGLFLNVGFPRLARSVKGTECAFTEQVAAVRARCGPYGGNL